MSPARELVVGADLARLSRKVGAHDQIGAKTGSRMQRRGMDPGAAGKPFAD